MRKIAAWIAVWASAGTPVAARAQGMVCTRAEPQGSAPAPLSPGEGQRIRRVWAARDGRGDTWLLAFAEPRRIRRGSHARWLLRKLDDTGATSFTLDVGPRASPDRVAFGVTAAADPPWALVVRGRSVLRLHVSGEGALALEPVVFPAAWRRLPPLVAWAGTLPMVVGRDLGRVRVTFLDAQGTESVSRVHRLDPQLLVTGAAAGPEQRAALVVRTPGRRHTIALSTHAGRLQFPGTAPAGCEGAFCPDVQLVPDGDGWLAVYHWRRDADGLHALGARALDARAAATSPALHTLPVVDGRVVPGPRAGMPLAIQLGHPAILRGLPRPIALDTPESTSAPVDALAWRTDDGALSVLVASGDGALRLTRITCARAP